MLYGIINLIVDLFCILIFGIFFIWMIFILFENYWKRKGNKRASKQLKNIKSKLKIIGKKVWSGFLMFMAMVLCTIFAIAVKPIIYKLNFPLGEGYSTFASYIIAICLWMILRQNTKEESSQ